MRNAKVSSRTTEMMEYLLYQLNLSMMSAMISGSRSDTEFCRLPCDSAEIEDLNLLLLAAGSGEFDDETADREIRERIAVIVERIHSVEGMSEYDRRAA